MATGAATGAGAIGSSDDPRLRSAKNAMIEPATRTAIATGAIMLAFSSATVPPASAVVPARRGFTYGNGPWHFGHFVYPGSTATLQDGHANPPVMRRS